MVLIVNYHSNQMKINEIYMFHLMLQGMKSLIIQVDLTSNLIIQHDVM